MKRPAWNSQEATRERVLDADLERLVNAAMVGDRPAALCALADAQVHGLLEHRAPALSWVGEHLVLLEGLPVDVPDDVDPVELLARPRRGARAGG